MLYLLNRLLDVRSNPMNTWDFKREGFAEIWIAAGQVFIE